MRLAFVTYCWGSAYGADQVNAAARMVAANVAVPHRFIAVTDQPEGMACDTLPIGDVPRLGNRHLQNWAKLGAFDAEFQRSLGDRVVLLDLDLVVTGDLTPLVTRPAPFSIMEGTARREGYRVAPYNSSIWVCDAGAEPQVWSEFGPDALTELDAARRAAPYPIGGSDQAWISIKAPGADVLTVDDGLYQAGVMPDPLPGNARIVFFAGRERPWEAKAAELWPGLAATWQCYAQDKVKLFRRRSGGRCLVLGTGATVWRDAEAALDAGPVDGVVACPAAALHWPVQVDGLGQTIEAAVERASRLGFDDIVVCGDEAAREAA